MTGKIIIDTEKCKGCCLCVSVCPKNSIAVSEKSNSKGYYPPRKVSDDCTGCCKCAVVCPDAAIEVQRDKSERIKSTGGHSKDSRVSLVEGRV